jgi:hypothetical protein
MRITGNEAETLALHYKKSLEKMNMAFFTRGDYNLNIVGVRNDFGLADKFDDKINVIYRVDSEWVFDSYPATTEPGTSILQRPLKSVQHKGTAILIPGQYRSTYQIHTHGGKRKYKALCQRAGTVWVWRDNNRDRLADIDGPREEGMFGINIHRQWGPDDREYTGGVSAGCQVFQSSLDFYQFMETCQIASDTWGNLFTYTLVNEKQLK